MKAPLGAHVDPYHIYMWSHLLRQTHISQYFNVVSLLWYRTEQYVSTQVGWDAHGEPTEMPSGMGKMSRLWLMTGLWLTWSQMGWLRYCTRQVVYLHIRLWSLHSLVLSQNLCVCVCSYQAPPSPLVTLVGQAITGAGHTDTQVGPTAVSIVTGGTFLEQRNTNIRHEYRHIKYIQ